MKNKLAIFKILAIIIVVSLLWSNYNYYFNTHFHIDNNGRIVLHSHPYSKNSSSRDLPNHHHNKNEFFVLHFLHRTLASLLILFLIIFLFFRQNKIIHIFLQTYPNKLLFKHNITQRGPPHFFYCS